MIAAARGSVARACAFSSSVRVSTRRVRISSISVESNIATALSGATAGWSDRMIGAASTTSDVCPSGPPSPASTGQQRCWRQRPAASRASSGGSITETNRAPAAASSRCVPISDEPQGGVLVRGPARRCCGRRPAAAAPGRRAAVCSATSARSGQRRRTSRPPAPSSTSSPPSTCTASVHPAAQLGDARSVPSSRSTSTASSQVVQTAAPARSSGDGGEAAGAVGALGLPALQLQEAQVHGHRRAVVVRPQQALDGEVGLLPQPGGGRAGRAEHAELPAHLVLRRGRPVGVEQVPLVEDGVGGEPGQGEASRPLPRRARSASSVVTASSQLVSPRTCR